jgi:acyl carrier protein
MVDIYGRLNEVFRDVFDDEDLVVTPQLTANDVEGWDSLTHIRLVLSVEKEFGVKFSSGDVARLKNVGEFAELIAKKLGTQVDARQQA